MRYYLVRIPDTGQPEDAIQDMAELRHDAIANVHGDATVAQLEMIPGEPDLYVVAGETIPVLAAAICPTCGGPGPI